MAFTIEDVNSRTLLQQFHSLYKRQQETDENVSELSGDLDQEIQDRTTADAELSEEIASIQSQLDSLGNIFTLKGSVQTIADLPASNNHIGDVYYVVSESTGYVWIDDNGTERWEQLGISVDLSNYVTQSDLETGLSGKQNTLTAGTNISIIGDTISATQPDTSKFEMLSGVSAPSSATAGAVGQKYHDTTKNDIYVCTAKTDNGDDTFSYTWLLTGGNGKQNKLTAGTNISILGDTISAGGMANPMTTAGDIIYGGASGEPTSLPIGTAGQVLKVKANGLMPEWANESGGSLYHHSVKIHLDSNFEGLSSGETSAVCLEIENNYSTSISSSDELAYILNGYTMTSSGRFMPVNAQDFVQNNIRYRIYGIYAIYMTSLKTCYLLYSKTSYTINNGNIEMTTEQKTQSLTITMLVSDERTQIM